MVYSLTDKLSFDENPQIEIKGKKITVKAEAEIALQLFDLLETEGEMKATLKAIDLLFSEKDKAYIKSLKLGFDDYALVLRTAMDLCVGNDPDEEPGSKSE